MSVFRVVEDERVSPNVPPTAAFTGCTPTHSVLSL